MHMPANAFDSATIVIYEIKWPNIHYCECTSCCDCSQVIIPTDVFVIGYEAFSGCGGGYELKEVIIST